MKQMQEDVMSMTDVIGEIECWLAYEFPCDASPSELRKSLQKLDDISTMPFSEIMEAFPELASKIGNEFDFDIDSSQEFDSKLDKTISDHISFLEESSEEYGEDDWSNF